MSESSTTILRCLLDERGVEYDESTQGNTTLFRFDYSDSCDDYLHTIAITGACISAYSDYLTPEQAIAATLGNGECGVEWWPMHDDEAGYRDDRDTEFLVYGCKHVAHEWGCRLQVDMLTPEKVIAATLGEVRAGSSRFELTAEQVREAIFNGSSYASFDGAKYYADGIGMQAIADELNATLGRGECEIETKENWLPAEQYHRCKHCGAFFAVMDASGDIPPCVCPNCGKAVKR